MFTGIVEEVGRVSAVRRQAGYQRTTVAARRVLGDLKVGDSLCVSGACHTVVSFDDAGFTIESVDETLRQTTIGRLRVGSRVNLERSLRLSDRLGGHLVAGHVDGVGEVLRRQESGGNVMFRIGVQDVLSRYIARKGSVAVDGISLTVVSAGELDFTVALIPYTLSETTMGERRPGDAVNVEADTISRYVERLMRYGRGPEHRGLTADRVREMGYGAGESRTQSPGTGSPSSPPGP